MYATLQRRGKGTDLSCFGSERSLHDLRQRKLSRSTGRQLTKLSPLRAQVSKSNPALCVDRMEQLSKKMAGGGNQASPAGVGVFRKVRGVGSSDPPGNGLQLEKCVWTHV